MGRFTKNNMLAIGTFVFALGLVLSALAWANAYSETTVLDWYDGVLALVPGQGEGGQDWNVLLMIVGPVLLVTGAFYGGEQLVLRRRFDRLIDTAKKSEFVSNRKDLEDLAKRLPTGYRRRVEEKEASFRSLR